MPFELLHKQAVEQNIYRCVLANGHWEGRVLVMGNLANDAELPPLVGTVELEGVTTIRAASTDCPTGISSQSGLLIFCGEVTKVYANGDLTIAADDLLCMLDHDEADCAGIEVGQRCSIACTDFMLVLDD